MLALPQVKLSPAARVAFGLVALSIAWLLLFELLVGFWPNQDNLMRELRQNIIEKIAGEISHPLQARDFKALKQTVAESANQKQVKSVGIRLKNGAVVAQSSNHALYWKPTSEGSTLDFVSVNLNYDNKPWADLEVAFEDSGAKGLWGWLSPTVLKMALAALGALTLYILYLRKAFEYLNPSSVIPDRVRVAFDAFSEGVIMIDRTGRIMFSNKTLTNWANVDNTNLFGKNINQLDWMKNILTNNQNNYPWVEAMEKQESVTGWRFDIKKASGETIKSIVNCSPVLDEKKSVRGCLITFDNVSKLEDLNDELQLTNQALEKSRKDLDLQNEELRKLATRDPMTSCLNRRAFFEMAEPLFEQAKLGKIVLCCIMADIDHFKRFNDTYGHTVGDKVIVSVSRNLFSGLRAEDLFCRYGGEEFCILLPDATLATTQNLAERLRGEIETKAGSSVRTIEGLKVTSSFGIASMSKDTASLTALIDLADQALYKAKNNGRNRVEIL